MSLGYSFLGPVVEEGAIVYRPGRIASARILCASAQNQARAEQEPTGYGFEGDVQELRDRWARAVRNYDF